MSYEEQGSHVSEYCPCVKEEHKRELELLRKVAKAAENFYTRVWQRHDELAPARADSPIGMLREALKTWRSKK